MKKYKSLIFSISLLIHFLAFSICHGQDLNIPVKVQKDSVPVYSDGSYEGRSRVNISMSHSGVLSV